MGIMEDIRANPNGDWDWYNICSIEELDEDFLREFQDKLFWWRIPFRQNLSEPFMKEFKDKIYWEWLSEDNLKRINDFEFLCKIFPKLHPDDHYSLFDKETLDKLLLLNS